jgi:GNAT superfamily N-acetyltransferase
MDVEIAADDGARAASRRLRHVVNEQGVSEADESDGLDSECTHVLASSGQVPIGAARFRVIGDTLKKQRVCVSRDFRGKGVGSAIIGFIVAHAKSNRLATSPCWARKLTPSSSTTGSISRSSATSIWTPAFLTAICG